VLETPLNPGGISVPGADRAPTPVGLLGVEPDQAQRPSQRLLLTKLIVYYRAGALDVRVKWHQREPSCTLPCRCGDRFGAEGSRYTAAEHAP